MKLKLTLCIGLAVIAWLMWDSCKSNKACADFDFSQPAVSSPSPSRASLLNQP